jgi:tellurite resistance protein TehA-like permease
MHGFLVWLLRQLLFYLVLHHLLNKEVLPHIFWCFSCVALLLVLAFLLGNDHTKKNLKTQHILVAAFITYFITDNSVRLIGLTQEYWYLTFAILFVLSGLVSWRSPKLFNKSGS